ncbi:MAG TPA: fructose-6-phosphate aldolase [Phycisphaerae bacterium]|nr:fructose-6-phosphate aldolase [Phycisphaerae bacterium]HRW51327.1 fructose-6-phosphate aldolase [Phycisphaerae bacterium]
MKFFIDTANIDEIRSAADMGVLDGVTTNPSLVAKEGREFRPLIAEICEIVPGPVSAEVVSTDCEGMMKEARELIKIADNIVIKLPTIPEGVKALKICSEEGIQTNMTLVFQPLQALIVAKAGATFVSPFLGRLDDIGQESMDMLADIRTIYDNYGFKTEILAASLRHPLHVLQAAKLGADVGTIPYKVITQLLHHPLTDIGLQKFLADWNNSRK